MVKPTQTVHQEIADKLSVGGYFVGLVLKGLIKLMSNVDKSEMFPFMKFSLQEQQK